MQTSAKVHLCAFADGQYAARKKQFPAEAED
jgi:hypothetical protein